MLKISIIEDNKKETQELMDVLTEWANTAFEKTDITVFSSGEEYFEKKIDETEDLIILDIKLDGMSGMEIANRLRSERRRCHILFLTAYSEFALEGYQYHAINYIVKPITVEKISKTLYEIVDEQRSHMYTFTDNSGSIIQLPFDDILYIISEKHSVKLHTRTNIFTENISISDIIGRLPKTFIRVHRSYIANMVNVERVSRTELVLTDQSAKPVPVGRSYAPDVQKRFAEYAARFERWG
ncbi:MAG: response regulator transcription factor [Lachnospiraceae bacterium]|nr:response regulator transcription factor [Lachnospiraceae bacterium]